MQCGADNQTMVSNNNNPEDNFTGKIIRGRLTQSLQILARLTKRPAGNSGFRPLISKSPTAVPLKPVRPKSNRPAENVGQSFLFKPETL